LRDVEVFEMWWCNERRRACRAAAQAWHKQCFVYRSPTVCLCTTCRFHLASDLLMPHARFRCERCLWRTDREADLDWHDASFGGWSCGVEGTGFVEEIGFNH